jgi:WD40 repeat protein
MREKRGDVDMKKQVIAVILLAVLLIAGRGAPVRAQDDGAPLVIFQYFDLWTCLPSEGTNTNLTESGVVLLPSMSPDGTRMAYLEYAPITLEAWQVLDDRSAMPPADVWIIDIRTGEKTLIAAQPEDASLLVPGVPNTAVIRSAPAWSPDGTMLAWSEMLPAPDHPSYRPIPLFDVTDHRLVIADLDGGETRIVTDLPRIGFYDGPYRVAWGGGGLAVGDMRALDSDEIAVLVYDTNGTLLAEYRQFWQDEPRLRSYAWVMLDDRDVVGFSSDDGWRLFDPLANTWLDDFEGEIVITSQLDPATSLSLVPPTSDDSHWRVVDAFMRGAIPLDAAAQYITLSPDGQQVAYMGEFGEVFVWQNGQAEPVCYIDHLSWPLDLFWGPVGLRVTQLP